MSIVYNKHKYKSDICIALNYYTPYVSGLTNVARDIAEGLAARGKKITVIASRHDKHLPIGEIINNVRVIRTPVVFSLGKGVISPCFIPTVLRESRNARVLNLHTPMLEAGPIASLSSIPVVTTYQCDVSLSGSIAASIQNKIIDVSSQWAFKNSFIVSVSSDDYAAHSRLKATLAGKTIAIPPTCHQYPKGSPVFRDGPGLHVGFLGRIVEEKGIEYLVEGFKAFNKKDARLLIAGDFKKIAGGSVVERVKSYISNDPRIKLLGFLPHEQIPDFYSSIDIFTLPSINPFEAFGIVQVEAMMMGIPVIASNLPGVRQPIFRTGMGIVVEPKSAHAITEALIKLSNNYQSLYKRTSIVRETYGINTVLDQFETTFNHAAESKKGKI